MIEVTARASHGFFHLEITGHAQSDRDGPIIPCAAVSTIVQTVVAGLQAVQKQYPQQIRLDIDVERSNETSTA